MSTSKGCCGMHACMGARVCVCVGALDENRESSRLGYKARIFCKLQTPVCDLVCSYLTTHTPCCTYWRSGEGMVEIGSERQSGSCSITLLMDSIKWLYVFTKNDRSVKNKSTSTFPRGNCIITSTFFGAISELRHPNYNLKVMTTTVIG